MVSTTFAFRRWRKKVGSLGGKPGKIKASQQEVADILEMDRSTVIELERGTDYRGRPRPVRKTIRLACAATILGVVDYDGRRITFGKPLNLGKGTKNEDEDGD